MIDLAALRADPAFFTQAWANRGMSVDVTALLQADEAIRQQKFAAEKKKAEQNQASKGIAAVAKAGGAADGAGPRAALRRTVLGAAGSEAGPAVAGRGLNVDALSRAAAAGRALRVGGAGAGGARGTASEEGAAEHGNERATRDHLSFAT